MTYRIVTTKESGRRCLRVFEEPPDQLRVSRVMPGGEVEDRSLPLPPEVAAFFRHHPTFEFVYEGEGPLGVTAAVFERESLSTLVVPSQSIAELRHALFSSADPVETDRLLRFLLSEKIDRCGCNRPIDASRDEDERCLHCGAMLCPECLAEEEAGAGGWCGGCVAMFKEMGSSPDGCPNPGPCPN